MNLHWLIKKYSYKYIYIVIMWPLWQKSPKRKSRDKNHPKYYLGQLNFYCNVLSNLAPNWRLGFWLNLRTQFFLIHAFCLYYKIGRASMYKPKIYFFLVFICRLSTYWGMKFYHPHSSLNNEEWVAS